LIEGQSLQPHHASIMAMLVPVGFNRHRIATIAPGPPKPA
jgi:hypothetical protein